MTDAVTCQTCGTALPPNAAFCTACGVKVAAAHGASASGSDTAVPEPGEDATRIQTPGLHEATRVLPIAPPPSAPSEPAAWAAPPAPGYPPSPPQMPGNASPWQPPPTAAPAPAPGAWEPRPPRQPEWAEQPPSAAPPWPPPAGQWQPPAGRTASASPGPPGAGLAAALAFIGAGLLVVCVFTVWFKVDSSGGTARLTGWQMATNKSDAQPFDSPDPAILLGIAAASLAVGGLLVAGMGKAVMRVLLVLAGVGAAAVLVRDYLSIKDTLKKSFTADFRLTFQYGFWIGGASAVVLIVAALVPSRTRA